MDRAPQVLQNRIEERWGEFGAHHAASVLEGAVDGSVMLKKSSGLTAPSVAWTILFIVERFGMRWPVLKRYSVTRDTPIWRANTLSGFLVDRIHASKVMHYG
jgi:tellurite resistance-related uncharacterized protein